MPLIQEAIARTGIARGTFVDLFAGSGVVSRLAKSLGYRVVANDWEPYAREINVGYLGWNHPPAYSRLGPGVAAVFDELNRLPPVEGYVTRHLCPRDDTAIDPTVDRLFFTRHNGGRIDAIRERLAEWEQAGLLSPAERSYVLAALLYAASYVSNTSGVFKGFHCGWGGAKGTALYRILSDLRLTPPLTFDNGEENLVTALDAQVLAEHLPDVAPGESIVYLDPPYNQHPYGANYHVLNTIALWDHPPLSPTIGGAGGKSAIRRDWRTARRSAYTSRHEARPALEKLLFTLRNRFILLSYSTDGLIPLESLLEVACRRGATTVLTHRYKRYRVSRQRYSPRSHTVEFILVIDGKARPTPERVAALRDEILGESGEERGLGR